jgi:uncharacterized membrane protein YjdF
MSSPLQRLYYVTEKTFKVDSLVSVLIILYNIIFVTEKTFKVDALVSVLVILYNTIFVAEKTFKVEALVSVLVTLYNIIFVTEKIFKVGVCKTFRLVCSSIKEQTRVHQLRMSSPLQRLYYIK